MLNRTQMNENKTAVVHRAGNASDSPETSKWRTVQCMLRYTHRVEPMRETEREKKREKRESNCMNKDDNQQPLTRHCVWACILDCVIMCARMFWLAELSCFGSSLSAAKPNGKIHIEAERGCRLIYVRVSQYTVCVRVCVYFNGTTLPNM